MEQRSDDRAALARRRCPRTYRRGVPRPARRPLARGHMGRGGGARREHGERPPREGRRRRATSFALVRTHDGRVGTVRLRPGTGRCSRRRRLPEQLAEGHRLRPRPLGVRRRALRGREPAAKVEAERASLPRLRHLLTYADLPALEAEGERFKAEHPTALDDAVARDRRGRPLHAHYTSGTTGPPKGCMIRHRNYYAMASVIDHLPEYVSDDDVMLLYLPLAHNFGRLMHLTGPYVGYTIAFLPDPLQTAAALQTVRPTVLPSVPRVYEKIHTAVVGAIDETTGVKRRLADWALGIGREVGKRQERGQPVGRALQLKHRVADRLVLREDPRAARRPAPDADLGRRAARPGDRGVLRRDRRQDLRGLRPERVHDGRDDEHARAAGASARSARRCPASSSGSRTTASC